MCTSALAPANPPQGEDARQQRQRDGRWSAHLARAGRVGLRGARVVGLGVRAWAVDGPVLPLASPEPPDATVRQTRVSAASRLGRQRDALIGGAIVPLGAQGRIAGWAAHPRDAAHAVAAGGVFAAMVDTAIRGTAGLAGRTSAARTRRLARAILTHLSAVASDSLAGIHAPPRATGLAVGTRNGHAVSGAAILAGARDAQLPGPADDSHAARLLADPQIAHEARGTGVPGVVTLVDAATTVADLGGVRAGGRVGIDDPVTIVIEAVAYVGAGHDVLHARQRAHLPALGRTALALPELPRVAGLPAPVAGNPLHQKDLVVEVTVVAEGIRRGRLLLEQDVERVRHRGRLVHERRDPGLVHAEGGGARRAEGRVGEVRLRANRRRVLVVSHHREADQASQVTRVLSDLGDGRDGVLHADARRVVGTRHGQRVGRRHEAEDLVV